MPTPITSTASTICAGSRSAGRRRSRFMDRRKHFETSRERVQVHLRRSASSTAGNVEAGRKGARRRSRECRSQLRISTSRPFAFRTVTTTVFAYRIGPLGYVTDAKTLPPDALEALRGVKVLVLNALFRTEHPTHLSVPEAIAVAARDRRRANVSDASDARQFPRRSRVRAAAGHRSGVRRTHGSHRLRLAGRSEPIGEWNMLPNGERPTSAYLPLVGAGGSFTSLPSASSRRATANDYGTK